MESGEDEITGIDMQYILSHLNSIEVVSTLETSRKRALGSLVKLQKKP